jgi:hypothetical protein
VTNEIAAGLWRIEYPWTMVGDGNTLQCFLSPSLSLLNFFLILLSPRWGYNVVFMEVRVLIEAIRNSGFNVRPTQNPRGNYVIFPTFLLTFFF